MDLKKLINDNMALLDAELDNKEELAEQLAERIFDRLTSK